jgi:D-sedoheptulose 7-phosphate isomerase
MNKIKEYFETSSKNISQLHKHEREIKEICKAIIECKNKENKILVGGNGGSCSDAEHFVGELQCTYKARNRKPISALSLASHLAAITAWSNDFEYLTYFKRQVQAHGKKDDILFLISTSGGDKKTGASMSLVEAAIEGKKRGMKIFSLLGKSGGVLKDVSDNIILVENNVTSFIQEAHISILHCICETIDNRLLDK